MKTVEIICPIYEGEEYIEGLNQALMSQTGVEILGIHYVLTESEDGSEEKLKKCATETKNVDYKKIKRSEFSHSLVREKAAFSAKSDVVVFVTQDVEIRDEKWCCNLVKDIDEEVVAAYSRQKTKYDNIEKYTRERNYPEKSFVVSKDDIGELGLRTFFFSDASGAVKTSVFRGLGGYDGKDLPISEDMYFAYKAIMAGYKIKYATESVVYHSHKFSLRQVYERYRLTGEFMKQNSYLDKYGTDASGADMAKYILKRAISEKNWRVLLRWLPDMGARYMGMKAGKRSDEAGKKAGEKE